MNSAFMYNTISKGPSSRPYINEWSTYVTVESQVAISWANLGVMVLLSSGHRLSIYKGLAINCSYYPFIGLPLADIINGNILGREVWQYNGTFNTKIKMHNLIL